MGVHDISRRHMLAISAAAGSLASGGLASAQAAQKIEQFDSALDNIISS